MLVLVDDADVEYDYVVIGGRAGVGEGEGEGSGFEGGRVVRVGMRKLDGGRVNFLGVG